MCIEELRAEVTATRKRRRPQATVIASQRKFVVAMQTADTVAVRSPIIVSIVWYCPESTIFS